MFIARRISHERDREEKEGERRKTEKDRKMVDKRAQGCDYVGK